MASSTLTSAAVVDVGDIQVLAQKCDRVDSLLARSSGSFSEFIAAVRILVTAARIITTEHLPANQSSASSETCSNG
jgi:hypothetical protein